MCVCVYNCVVHIQHRIVLIILTLILHTIITVIIFTDKSSTLSCTDGYRRLKQKQSDG